MAANLHAKLRARREIRRRPISAVGCRALRRPFKSRFRFWSLSALVALGACAPSQGPDVRESAFGPATPCPLSRADCDGNPQNGCETDTDLDLSHCGGCTRVCSTKNASSRCLAGFCRLTCAAGYADCNLRSEDGCEALLVEDGLHCGQCGVSCRGGGCNDGGCGTRPTLFATGIPAPGALAAEGGLLFVAGQGTSANEFMDGQIIRLDADGGSSTVLASSQRAPVAIAVEAGRPFWTYPGTSLNGFLDGTLSTVRSDGGTQQLAFAQRGATALSAFDGGVYWVNTEAGSLSRVDVDGGVTSVLASALPLPISVSASARGVFFGLLGVEEGAGVVLQFLPGGGLLAVAEGQPEPVALTADDAALYWLNRGSRDAGFENGAVVRAPLDGGAAIVLAGAELDPGSIFVDDTGVYWTSLSGGTVKRVGKDGQGERMLASGFFGPSGVVVVGDTVFFTVIGDGTVRSVPRP